MLEQLAPFLTRPALYAPATARFWDDEHISKSILKTHLDPAQELASRSAAFIDRSAEWIARCAPPREFPALLDLGCGPGLYAERFAQTGYRVVGIDFSRRSIAYAREMARQSGGDIEYHYRDYLTIDYREQFDLAALIYCDFGALSAADRKTLLKKVRAALRPGGRFVLDAFTPLQHRARPESHSWSYFERGGFWSAEPHLCLSSFYRYDRDDTVLDQTIVVTGARTECYNIWERCFTRRSLGAELGAAGFEQIEWFGDVCGAPYTSGGATLCAVVTK